MYGKRTSSPALLLRKEKGAGNEFDFSLHLSVFARDGLVLNKDSKDNKDALNTADSSAEAGGY